jgi:hypothetical protein
VEEVYYAYRRDIADFVGIQFKVGLPYFTKNRQERGLGVSRGAYVPTRGCFLFLPSGCVPEHVAARFLIHLSLEYCSPTAIAWKGRRFLWALGVLVIGCAGCR